MRTLRFAGLNPVLVWSTLSESAEQRAVQSRRLRRMLLQLRQGEASLVVGVVRTTRVQQPAMRGRLSEKEIDSADRFFWALEEPSEQSCQA